MNGKIVRNERKYERPNPFEDVILAIDEFKDSPLIARPGEKFSYSTHAYILLSAIVERAGKQNFAEQVRQRIVGPLQLTTLQPDYQWIDIPHSAAGYLKRQKEIVRSTDTDVSWKLGGGGFISNIDDLALFCAAVTRRDLLRPATWDVATTVQVNAAGVPTGYGLGFRIDGQGADKSVGHSGAQEKTRTSLIAFPAHGFGAVAMTNSEYGQPGVVVEALIKELAPAPLPVSSD
jgi:CubicO group peptidase (beta-lactamase class C family)